jgi:hypothetical protein
MSTVSSDNRHDADGNRERQASEVAARGTREKSADEREKQMAGDEGRTIRRRAFGDGFCPTSRREVPRCLAHSLAVALCLLLALAFPTALTYLADLLKHRGFRF